MLGNTLIEMFSFLKFLFSKKTAKEPFSHFINGFDVIS